MRKFEPIDVGVQNVVNLTLEQAKARYNIGENSLYKISNEIGADIFIGKKHLYSKKRLDNYFESL